METNQITMKNDKTIKINYLNEGFAAVKVISNLCKTIGKKTKDINPYAEYVIANEEHIAFVSKFIIFKYNKNIFGENGIYKIINPNEKQIEMYKMTKEEADEKGIIFPKYEIILNENKNNPTDTWVIDDIDTRKDECLDILISDIYNTDRSTFEKYAVNIEFIKNSIFKFIKIDKEINKVNMKIKDYILYFYTDDGSIEVIIALIKRTDD